MENQELIGRKVKDTKREYKGDVGEVTDIRHFEKANITYAVVKWNKGSKHGEVYRNYKPKEIGGIFDRFKFIN